MITPGAYYVRAQRARASLYRDTLNAMESRSVLVAPTAAVSAPRIDTPGRALSVTGEAVNLTTAALRFTAPFNITGQPALAIPTGLAADGLPLSMQIIGRPFDEVTVFQVAAAYESARPALPIPKSD
jgi:aspartyl-tRNA(Asn)/glutamyl-tRNA(Gln) amidotransferase subunit A